MRISICACVLLAAGVSSLCWCVLLLPRLAPPLSATPVDASVSVPLDSDAEVLALLRSSPILAVAELDAIGVTPAFRVQLGRGRWGIFKAQVCHTPAQCQQFAGDACFREVLAYHASVLLGVRRTPPVVGRAIPHELFAELLPRVLARPSWGRYKGDAIRAVWDKAITRGISADGLVLGCLSLGLEGLQERASSKVREV
jgi:hypothetical protein